MPVSVFSTRTTPHDRVSFPESEDLIGNMSDYFSNASAEDIRQQSLEMEDENEDDNDDVVQLTMKEYAKDLIFDPFYIQQNCENVGPSYYHIPALKKRDCTKCSLICVFFCILPFVVNIWQVWVLNTVPRHEASYTLSHKYPNIFPKDESAVPNPLLPDETSDHSSGESDDRNINNEQNLQNDPNSVISGRQLGGEEENGEGEKSKTTSSANKEQGNNTDEDGIFPLPTPDINASPNNEEDDHHDSSGSVKKEGDDVDKKEEVVIPSDDNKDNDDQQSLDQKPTGTMTSSSSSSKNNKDSTGPPKQEEITSPPNEGADENNSGEIIEPATIMRQGHAAVNNALERAKTRTSENSSEESIKDEDPPSPSHSQVSGQGAQRGENESGIPPKTRNIIPSAGGSGPPPSEQDALTPDQEAEAMKKAEDERREAERQEAEQQREEEEKRKILEKRQEERDERDEKRRNAFYQLPFWVLIRHLLLIATIHFLCKVCVEFPNGYFSKKVLDAEQSTVSDETKGDEQQENKGLDQDKSDDETDRSSAASHDYNIPNESMPDRRMRRHSLSRSSDTPLFQSERGSEYARSEISVEMSTKSNQYATYARDQQELLVPPEARNNDAAGGSNEDFVQSLMAKKQEIERKSMMRAFKINEESLREQSNSVIVQNKEEKTPTKKVEHMSLELVTMIPTAAAYILMHVRFLFHLVSDGAYFSFLMQVFAIGTVLWSSNLLTQFLYCMVRSRGVLTRANCMSQVSWLAIFAHIAAEFWTVFVIAKGYAPTYHDNQDENVPDSTPASDFDYGRSFGFDFDDVLMLTYIGSVLFLLQVAILFWSTAVAIRSTRRYGIRPDHPIFIPVSKENFKQFSNGQGIFFFFYGTLLYVFVIKILLQLHEPMIPTTSTSRSYLQQKYESLSESFTYAFPWVYDFLWVPLGGLLHIFFAKKFFAKKKRILVNFDSAVLVLSFVIGVGSQVLAAYYRLKRGHFYTALAKLLGILSPLGLTIFLLLGAHAKLKGKRALNMQKKRNLSIFLIFSLMYLTTTSWTLTSYVGCKWTSYIDFSELMSQQKTMTISDSKKLVNFMECCDGPGFDTDSQTMYAEYCGRFTQKPFNIEDEEGAEEAQEVVVISEPILNPIDAHDASSNQLRKTRRLGAAGAPSSKPPTSSTKAVPTASGPPEEYVQKKNSSPDVPHSNSQQTEKSDEHRNYLTGKTQVFLPLGLLEFYSMAFLITLKIHLYYWDKKD